MSGGCISAGRSGGYFYIDWNGNASPCVFFPYNVANVNQLFAEEKTLNDILMSDYHRSARETILRHRAKPIDQESANAIEDDDYARRLEAYDEAICRRLDPLWEEEESGRDGKR
jgi:hypothetical protein